MEHHLFESIGEGHDLIQRDATTVSGLIALATSCSLEYTNSGRDFVIAKASCLEGGLVDGDLVLARFADFSEEALREHQVDRSGDEEGLHAHVEQARNGAWRIVGVQCREHQVARERGFDGDLRSLEVADLTDHDDVWILAQERAQRGREVEADVVVHLHLIDPHQVVFDGIFGGADVRVDLIELGQRRVERRGFSGAGGSGDEHHAVRLVDRVLEVFERFGVEAELGHVELEIRLVEEAQDDLFAPDRRKARDAEVHLFAFAELELDASVLGQSSLGDVERRHDFEARCDGVLELERRGHLFDEHTVHTVTNAQFALIRLDMNVARALFDGVEKDGVAESNDGRVLACSFEIAEVDVFVFGGDFDFALLEPFHDLVVRDVGRGIMPLDRFENGGFRGDDGFHVVAGQELDVVDRVQVGWIDHRDDERRARARNRNDLVPFAHFLADHFPDIFVDLVFIEVDRLNAVLLAQEVGDLLIRDVPHAREGVAKRGVRLFGLVLRGFELLETDQFLTYEKLAETVAHEVASGKNVRAMERRGRCVIVREKSARCQSNIAAAKVFFRGTI